MRFDKVIAEIEGCIFFPHSVFPLKVTFDDTLAQLKLSTIKI